MAGPISAQAGLGTWARTSGRSPMLHTMMVPSSLVVASKRPFGLNGLVASSGNFGEKLPLLARPHAATVLPPTSPTVTSG
jgi:hypothetical protein